MRRRKERGGPEPRTSPAASPILSSGPNIQATTPFLTTAEAATYLRFRSASGVWNLARRAGVRPFRRGRVALWTPDLLGAMVPAGGSYGQDEVPGIWKLPKGGYFVRTSGIDPRTGRLRPIKRKLPKATLKQALQEVERLREVARSGGSVRQPNKPTLTAYAQSWLEIHLPRMTSDLTKARYVEALDLHVLPDLGGYFVDQIQPADLNRWLVKPRLYGDDENAYSVHTVNGWWRVLKMVLQAAAREHRLPDPTGG